MPEHPAPGPAWLDARTLSPAREKVRALLTQADAYQKLEPDERVRIANQMVKVAAYMSNPDGLAADELDPATESVLSPPATGRGAAPVMQQAATPPTAGALRDSARGVREASERASADHGFAGEDFEGGAIAQGTEQFGELVQTVDFPKFVGGLVENVFQAIVDSSIQQMRAYGELLANVAKTVDEFAVDNITSNNARDWLSDAFPDVIGISGSGDGFGNFGNFGNFGAGFAAGDGGEEAPQPKLVAKGDDPEQGLADVSEKLAMARPVTDLSDEDQEARLVQAARLHIARSRQRLLASMVVLGINRIVVTDGQIRAKVVFGMRASDVASRASRASLHDQQSSRSRASFAAGGWFGGWGAAGGASSASSHVTTVKSAVDERSQSQAELRAQLSGDVRVNFKSDYFPMEKLASPEMISAIQGNATPADDGVSIG